MRRAAPFLLLLLACGRTDVYGKGEKPVRPVVSIDPGSQVFAGSVQVTIQSQIPSVIRYTLDGLDPATSLTAESGVSPRTFTVERTTIVRAVATSSEKMVSDAASSFYERGGPASGTIAGDIFVGLDAVGKRVGVSYTSGGRGSKMVSQSATLGPLPFKIEGLAGGTWTVRAVADTNSDNQLTPFQELTSEPESTDLVLSDPRRAGAEGMELYLGRSRPGLSALFGVIHVPRPRNLRPLSMMLLDASGLGFGGGGAGLDPATLLGQLASPPWSTQTRVGQTDYPYKIYNIAPGSYLPMPALGALGLSGLRLSFLVNGSLLLFGGLRVPPDSELRQDFAYGPADISGNAIKRNASSPVAIGMVAFKPADLTFDFQVTIGATLLLPQGGGVIAGNYAVEAQRLGSYAARVFTSDGGSDPITGALTWLVNPFDRTGATIIDAQGDTVTDILIP